MGKRNRIATSFILFPGWRRVSLGGLFAAALAIGGTVWASGDSSCDPGWRLDAAALGCTGQATLNPGNDTRVNMVWLMRSLGAKYSAETAPLAGIDDPRFGQTFFSWNGLRSALWPAPTQEPATPADAPASSCETAADAIPSFNAALAGERKLPAVERAILVELREKVGCEAVSLDVPAIQSAVGRDYLAYLKAAQAFHADDWAGAKQGFAGLARSRSRWIAETATYMPIRIGLRAAVAKAVDEYGDFAGPEKVDSAAVASARDAIVAYLRRYPGGRYAGSAQGLTRRIAWLTGDSGALARSYEKLLATTPGDSEAAADLAEEIDRKLLDRPDADSFLDTLPDTPLLLAIADLRRMRKPEYEYDRPKAADLSGAQLDGQKARFAEHADLYDLLQATQAFYAGEAPQTIMARLPDAAGASRFTPLAFSRQVLRGMALAKVRDPDEVRFWRALLTGASPLYQKPLVEMGLAIRWQHDGRLDQIFALDSPVTDSMTRQILLQTVATPAIVRESVRDMARPAHERDVARFTLLYKNLTHGAFADVGRDLPLIPDNADTKGGLWSLADQEAIPIGLFRSGQWSDGSIACQPLAQTAATLARSATDRKALLCLGEFYRLNGFDGFALFWADPQKHSLGVGPDGFPGAEQSRFDIYTAIIADRQASPDERAYALYRAVMCYAPSGNNGCTVSHASWEEQEAERKNSARRKAWFMELKQRYPGSQWAQSLRYYW